jgi:HEAT repeat protein
MDLQHAVLVLAVLLPVLVAAAFLLGRHLQRKQYLADDLSPVTRQHIDLIQGGQLSEAAVESTKARFRDLLERGDVAAVEAALRPGTQYVVQVRALAEIGTEDAGRILERQLQRRLTEDQIEQSWYWIDLASCLRVLNRDQSLPHLLRCAESAGEWPLGHFFAAETVHFLGFAGYLGQPDSPLGRSALRVLHRALEGLRCGVPPHIVADARLGEHIERLWDHRPEAVDPLIVRVFAEALRLLRRAPHAEAALAEEKAEQEAFTWQMSRVAALEPVLRDYLQEAPSLLCDLLPRTTGADQRDALQALHDLRAEAGPAILPLLGRSDFGNAELAVDVLTWSQDPHVGLALRDWALRKVPILRRAQGRRRAAPPRRPSVPAEVPYRSILRALRGHGSSESEKFLLVAACDWDPTYRAAAVSSLGWWEPVHRYEVLVALQKARRDPNPEVRQAARAALARLGERQALQMFRQGLTSDDSQRVHETIQFIANEGLTLLWADLDHLTETDDTDVGHHAREALERLCEDMEFGRGR